MGGEKNIGVKGETMGKHKRKPLPVMDGVPFLETCEQAIVDGNAGFISANLAKVRRFVVMYQNRIYQLSPIQFRARGIIEQHEPSAEKR